MRFCTWSSIPRPIPIARAPGQRCPAAFPDTPPLPPTARPFPDYLRHLVRHRFCACPRGNGIDTHRFWECAYLGIVPVVERSPHTDLWAREGLPMVALEDWSELSRELLESFAIPPRRDQRCLRLSHYAALVAGAEAPRSAQPAPLSAATRIGG